MEHLICLCLEVPLHLFALRHALPFLRFLPACLKISSFPQAPVPFPLPSQLSHPHRRYPQIPVFQPSALSCFCSTCGSTCSASGCLICVRSGFVWFISISSISGFKPLFIFTVKEERWKTLSKRVKTVLVLML